MVSNIEDDEVASSCHTETTPLLSNSESPESDISGSWGAELWLLLQYSVPLIATYLLQYSYSVITTFVAGHLSADALAAASIGMTTMNIVGFATIEGMATALDTLCAQAYGSGSLHGVGLHVQKMLLLMALSIIPIGIFWICSPWVLSLFVRQQHLAVMAGSFLRVSLIGLPGYASFEAGKRFLQAQGDFKAALFSIIICSPINALLSWFFVFRMGMGLDGAALGVALTNNLRPVLLLFYIMLPVGKWTHQCWGGFSRDALSKWGPMVRLSFAGFAVNLGEWAAFEMMTFSTSYLSTNHIAAQSVVMTISIVSWHIPFSLSVAISTRIGHLIGAGLVKTARRAAVLYAVVCTIVGSVDGFIIFALRNQLLTFFSEDDVVCDIASKTMLTVAVFQIIDAIICCTNGLLRGLGRQSFAAWVVLAVNYLGAVPLAMWLELGSPALGLNGVWIGLGSGMVLTAVIEGAYMKSMRWQDCVASVKSREGL
ncbi:MATE efflux family protein [Annulohypoxylon maeteangense]|uniref:MATE efflux family protein n=1 Tax=Annulohypoxylon maeteangense TaxID=1927788 RepID=UPI0020088A53|nr:MATE efflux family protein [Annulohypoxylon maeteangense]KAI0882307.1 MATE efflux family protein [Annulohypoxylon maeteangense]